MIYNTGTISFSGNTITGTGTNFTAPASQIRLGQTLLVASNPVQLVQITAINSATSLTVIPAASTAVSGQKYGIFITDSLSVDGLAQSISQLINEYDENIGAWELFATTSANQSVTVTINGQTVTIPALGKLLQKGSNGALTVKDGGTGATDVAGARTNLGFVNDLLPVSYGGTGAKDASGARSNIGAAASGANTDITSLTKLTSTITRDNWVADNGLIVTLDALNNVSYNNKAVMAITKHNGITLNTSFGYAIGADGSASSSGPALICTDTNSYTRTWKFLNGPGIIATTSGNITPGASDERVKNIIREISEDEAVRVIQGLKPIRYAFKWSPEQIKVGYSAQNVEALDPELLSITPLTIPDPEQPENPMASVTIEDGKVVDPGEIGSAYLVPVVQQLLRRVGELEAVLNQQEP